MTGQERRWRILLTQSAVQQLGAIKDRRVQQQLRQWLRALEQEPEQQGKPLAGDLAGYRSLRAVGQRYRVLYTVEAEQVVVYVVAVGIRKEGDRSDVYALAKKLLRQGLLAQEEG